MSENAELTEARRRLAETEGRLRAILDHVPAVVFLRDLDGCWVTVNEHLADVLGVPADELIGQPLEASHAAEVAAAFRAEDREVLRADEPRMFEVTVDHAGLGVQREWLLQKFPVRDSDGNVLGVGGVSVDITERRTAERERQAAQELFAAAFDHAPVGKVISRLLPDRSTELIKVNPAFAEMVGLTAEQVCGGKGALVCHPDDIPIRLQLIDAAIAGKPEVAELRLLHHGGGHVWARIASVAVPASDGQLLLVTQAIDITDRRELERQLRELADRDELTGLLSRRRFILDLEREAARARRVGATGQLLLLDLDGFKAINDRHGHAAGDRVLCEVANVLREQLRGTDLVGRLGGDEFAVILPDTDEEGARATVAKLTVALAAPDGADVSASIGLTPLGASTAATLLAEADAAMYAVKRRRQRLTAGDGVEPRA